MKGSKKKGGAARTLSSGFVRGAVATGMLAAVQDKKRGGELLRTALLGGTALTTAESIERLLFNKELKLGKKKKGKNKAGLNLGDLESLLAQRAPSGLAALGTGQQFLTGALLGATAVYLLGDEQIRAKLIRAGMQLYAGMTGEFEEIKEQMADIQAELAAERNAL
ncbi:hypothetical protein MASR1M60_26190 [Rhodocyclaceae bacterium]